jgi:hypothetical protein
LAAAEPGTWDAALARALTQGRITPREPLHDGSRRKRARPGIVAILQGGTKMKNLKLKPEQLRVESFSVQNLRAEESRMETPGVTLCLPYTCPECPHTRNPLLCS